jgi:hypothetical protein
VWLLTAAAAAFHAVAFAANFTQSKQMKHTQNNSCQRWIKMEMDRFHSKNSVKQWHHGG